MLCIPDWPVIDLDVRQDSTILLPSPCKCWTVDRSHTCSEFKAIEGGVHISVKSACSLKTSYYNAIITSASYLMNTQTVPRVYIFLLVLLCVCVFPTCSHVRHVGSWCP